MGKNGYDIFLGTGFLTVDGSFGPKTYTHVQDFQSFAGISQDGVVGPITWGKLCNWTQLQYMIGGSVSANTWYPDIGGAAYRAHQAVCP